MNLRLVVTGFMLAISFLAPGQKNDSLLLKVKSGVESQELIDLHHFEGISYFKMALSGKNIQKQYLVMTSHEFWYGKSMKLDTMFNTKRYGIKNGSDTIHVRVMSKKIKDDTVKVQFNFPRFSLPRQYKTTKKDTYILTPITFNSQQFFEKGKPVTLIVYSLPYDDPKNPGYSSYCELSKDGIPPEQWGEKFKVPHYIVFKIQLID